MNGSTANGGAAPQAARAARERRFDAELAAVLDVPVTGIASAAAAVPHGARLAGAAAWLAAALMLGGALATVAIAWQQRAVGVAPAEAPSREPQEPAPAGPQDPDRTEPQEPRTEVPQESGRGDAGRARHRHWADTAAQLAALPATATALSLGDTALAELAVDLSPLARFPALAELRLVGAGEWGLGALSTLGQLPRLEELHLAVGPRVVAAEIAALAPGLQLRDLTLYVRRALTPADVTALATLPALAELTLVGGELDAATVRAFALLPRLDVLRLRCVPRCSEDALVALGEVPRLRHLELFAVGARIQRKGDLTAPAASALCNLPGLAALELRAMRVSADVAAALPVGLRHLALRAGCVHGTATWRAFARCANLQRLDLDDGSDCEWVGWRDEMGAWLEGFGAPAVASWASPPADLLRALPLRELHCQGYLHETTRRALASTTIEVLAVGRLRAEDVRAIAGMRELRRLRVGGPLLRGESSPGLQLSDPHERFEATLLAVESLAPLQQAPKLTRLEVGFVSPTQLAALRTLLPRVQVAETTP